MQVIGIVNLYLKFKVNLSNAKEVIALKWADGQKDGRTRMMTIIDQSQNLAEV